MSWITKHEIRELLQDGKRRSVREVCDEMGFKAESYKTMAIHLKKMTAKNKAIPIERTWTRGHYEYWLPQKVGE